jgi:hypothetical protein
MMEEASRLHNQAMDYAESAAVAKRKGKIEDFRKLSRQALDLETKAAGLVEFEVEPSRSVLYRSAATLALDTREYELARKLAEKGISGNPPREIREELEDIFDRIKFRLNLPLFDIKLPEHVRAMDYAEEAIVAKKHGRMEEFNRLCRHALELEIKAAKQIKTDDEPLRSALYCSAGILALNCEEYDTAEKLAATGIAGDPPEEIAEELREIFERVNFRRHLALRGIVLDENEFQLSIMGKAVDDGLAPSDSIWMRIQTIETLVYRTFERLSHQPFKPTLQKSFQVYISPARAGSYSVTLHIGQPELDQATPQPSQVVDEILTCIRLLNEGREEEIKKRFSQSNDDPEYFSSFISLAKRLAPDGEDIQQVGFTSLREGKEESIGLTRSQDQVKLVVANVRVSKEELNQSPISIRGELVRADATQMEISIEDKEDNKTRIIVSEGTMSDIVRPLWEYEVEVTGILLKNGKMLLYDIQRV